MPLYHNQHLSAVPSIGIIGGVGPLASTVTVQKILECFVAHQDQDYPNIIHSSFSGIIADRTEHLIDDLENPVVAAITIGKSLCSLGSVVLGIPCNTFHSPIFFPLLKEEIKKEYPNVKIINMIQATMQYIKRTSIKKVGILATKGSMKSYIYDAYAERHNIILIKPDESNWQKIHNVVYDPIEGIKSKGQFISQELAQTINDEAQKLIDNGAEKIILGCTELSIYFANAKHNFKFIEPMYILAQTMATVFSNIPENKHLSFKLRPINVEL